MRLVFGTILLCLICCNLGAQTPSLIHYDVKDGLPGNQIYCGLQDRHGVLWFGTDKGLTSFDGIRFRIYSLADGLPDPEVLNIKEDRDGRLWLFCFRKKPCYMLNGRIITEKQDSILGKIESNSGLYNFSEGPDNEKWFFNLNQNGIFYDGKTIGHAVFPARTFNLFNLGGDYLLMGAYQISRFKSPSEIETIFPIPQSLGTLSITVSGNRILYSFSDGLSLFEWANGRITVIQQKKDLSGNVFTDKQGRFWVCAPGKGAVCFDNQNRDLSQSTVLLPGKRVSGMFEDQQGTIWFYTTDDGIYGLPRNSPMNYAGNIFPSKNIRAVNGAGNWIITGDDMGNINLINGSNIKSIALGTQDEYNLIRQIQPAGDGTFWLASDENLIHCDSRFSLIEKHLPNRSLKAIVWRRDTVWFASAIRFGFYSKHSGDNQIVIPKRFTTVGIDDQQYLWAGNIDGIYSEQDSFRHNWGDNFPELRSRIMCIQSGGPGLLWIVTPENGLLRARIGNGRIVSLEVINRMLETPVQNIQNLFVDAGNTVWMATNRGVYGLKTNGMLVHFDRFDGLTGDDVNAVYVRNDTLWAATASGLTAINLNQPDEQGDFATYIVSLKYRRNDKTDVQFWLDDRQTTQEAVLGPDFSSPELSLAGTDFRSWKNLRFNIVQQVQLLPWKWLTFNNIVQQFYGENKDTVLSSSPEYSLGTFLPPGRYLITATAVNASGIHSLHPARVIITKLPAWYQTIWFFLALWGVVIYGIWRFYKYRVAFKEMEAATAILQLQALQTQINPHFIGNSINAVQQFLHPPDPIKVSEYISLFMRLLRNTMEFSEKAFIPFSEELQYCREYLQLVQLRYGDSFQFNIQTAPDLPPDLYFPSIMLQPILENATIHGRATEGISMVEIQFFIKNDRMFCRISDNGIGINASLERKKQSGSRRKSKGMMIITERAASLNKLYGTDIDFLVEDKSTLHPNEHGTITSISFTYAKLWKIIRNQSNPV